MLHDQLCERDSYASTYLSQGCLCGSRAYAADPLPDDLTPIQARYTEDE